jgi:hypothetical protein
VGATITSYALAGRDEQYLARGRALLAARRRLPITVNFWPCRSSRKKRLRAVLTMRQRCGAPERTRSAGALRPLSSTWSASRPNTSPAEPPLSAASRRAVLVEADVAQDHRDLVGHAHAVVRVLDQQRAVEAEAHLRRRHVVRVIPEQPRVAQHEVVDEALARAFTAGCEMPGTPSISIGTRTPCQ